MNALDTLLLVIAATPAVVFVVGSIVIEAVMWRDFSRRLTAEREQQAQREADERRYGNDGGLR